MVKVDSIKDEEQIREIQNMIFLVTVDLLEKETIRENDMLMENLKFKIHEIFFDIPGPILK